MKSQILLLALTAAALSSCTTSYKTGQTPDDVYFSPVRQQDEYVQTERKDQNRYQSREDYYDDRYLRMRVADRQRWSELDDYYYFGNRNDYSYYNSLYWNNPWTPCTYWNNNYNPYYHSTVLVTPQSPVFNHPRTVNLNTFNTNMLTSSHYTNPVHPGFSLNGAPTNSSSNGYNSGSNYNNSNNNSSRSSGNVGNFLRNVFNNSGSSGSSGSSSNSSSGSSGASRPASTPSSSGSSGGGSAPVRRF
jgi:hypothetical protein